MSVSEYIESLKTPIRGLMELCPMKCVGCPLAKNADKPCPMRQLMDVVEALQYAVDNNVCNIKEDTSMDTAQVTIYLRRAVVNGRSIRTLRDCDSSYIKQKNLIQVGGDC